jgi:hypothetical protein
LILPYYIYCYSRQNNYFLLTNIYAFLFKHIHTLLKIVAFLEYTHAATSSFTFPVWTSLVAHFLIYHLTGFWFTDPLWRAFCAHLPV